MANNDDNQSKLDFNIDPYFDNYNEDRKFVKTLFRPTHAIQARELTQLQTTLQHQVSRLTDGLYKDGTMVVPGELAYDCNYAYVKIQGSYFNEDINPYNFIGTTIRGNITGIHAKVIHAEIKTEKEYDTLFIKYMDSGSGESENDVSPEFPIDYPAPSFKGLVGEESRFVKGEILTIQEEIFLSGPRSAYVIHSIDETELAVGNGSAAYIEEGIYYVRGFMVKVDKQFIVLDKYNNKPSYRIGLEVIEDIVTEYDDETLFDNAQGTPNQNAPGAHRHRIRLILSKRAIDSIDDENFIELLRLVNGKKIKDVRETELKVIEDILARRTYDESGDYTVKNFQIDVREFLNEGENRGVHMMKEFESDNQQDAMADAKSRFNLVDSNDNGVIHSPTLGEIEQYPEQELDIEKYYPGINHQELMARMRDMISIGLEPGKAYVKGYEIEKIGTTYLDYFKSRTYSSVSDDMIKASTGNYLFVSDLYSIPTPLDTIEFYDINSEFTSNAQGLGGKIIGTAKVKTVQLYNFTPDNDHRNCVTRGDMTKNGRRSAIWKMYIFDIEMKDGYSTDSARSFLTGSNDSFGNILTYYSLLNIPRDFDNSYYKFQVKSIYNETNVYDAVSYYYDTINESILVKHFDTTVFSSSEPIVTEYGKEATISAKLSLIDSSNNSMIYYLPYSDIKTLSDEIKQDTGFFVKKMEVFTVDSDGNATIKTGTNEYLVPFTDVDYNITRTVPSTKTIDLTDSNIIINSDLSTMNIKLGAINGGGRFKILFTIKKQGTAAKQKSKLLKKHTIAPYSGEDITGRHLSPNFEILSSIVMEHESFATSLVETQDRITQLTLDHSDVYNVRIFDTCDISFGTENKAGVGYQVNDLGDIKHIKEMTYDEVVYAYEDYIKWEKDNSYTTTTGEVPVKLSEITNKYDFSTGQKPSIYDLGKIKQKQNFSGPSGRLIVIYEYFEHGTGDYFSVDSYAGVLPYKDIPFFNGTPLSDAFDFRPSFLTEYDRFGINPVETTRDDRIGKIFNIDDYSVISPNCNITCNYQYYLSRRDKVFINKDGEFKITYGNPDIKPKSPPSPDDGMVLYDVFCPAFTYDIGDLELKIQDNRRYTMRDIGKLEKRVDKIEYYTSLSMLEKETQDMEVTDSSGLNRYKSGFIVDSFEGHGVGDYIHEDYKCSVDPANGELRPEFNQLIVNMEYNNGESIGVVRVGDMITLPFEEIEFAKQEFASQSINVNPYAIFTFNGSMTLAPQTDEWRDTTRAPDVVINNDTYDADVALAEKNGTLGTVWNNWQTDWVGTSTSDSFSGISSMRRNSLRNADLISQPSSWASWNRPARVRTRTRTTTTTDNQSRSGIKTTVVPMTTSQNMGDRVINTSTIPFIRNRKVLFISKGMKPNTRVYASFDNVQVSQYCTTAPYIDFTYNTTNIKLKVNDIIEKIGTNKTAKIKSVNMLILNLSGMWTCRAYLEIDPRNAFSSNDSIRKQGSTVSIATIDDYQASPAFGSELITDNRGTICGVFDIPNTQSLRFRCGEREFKLTDRADPERKDVDTSAESIYEARGVMETKQATIVSTRSAKFVQEAVSDNRTLTSTSTRNQVEFVTWYDPLAETFLITEDGGIFLTKVDVFFETKDPNIPVSIQIRETVNGYPGKKILPFSEVSIDPDFVQISDDASLPTTFEFETPVYLMGHVEYCFVLMTNCTGYKAFVSHMGEKNLGTDRTISTQPYAGVFFKSQNASTWTADQMKDLKFTLYKAQFDTKPGVIYLNNSHYDKFGTNLDIDTLSENPFVSTLNSDIVRVYHKNHDMFVNDNVVFEGIDTNATFNGIPASDLLNENGLTIKSTNMDTYTVRVPTTANATGEFGGWSVTAASNFAADVILPNITEVNLPGTTTQWSMRSTYGNPNSPSKALYEKENEYTSININENNYFNEPHVIASEQNEENRMSGNDISGSVYLGKKSLVYKCIMSTTNPNLSPMVDLDRVSAITISNRVDNPEGGDINDPEATDADGNSIYDPTDINYVEDYISEDKSYGGSAASKYVTKEITLQEASTSLRVMFNINRMKETGVDLYFKLKTTDELREFDDIPWIMAKRPPNYSNYAETILQFDEYIYDIDEYPDGTPFPDYISFAVKIVMRSENSSKVPRIKNFRAIALGT